MATMDSVTVDAAVAAMEMPRLGDGTVNLTELRRALLEQVVNAVMDTMAEAASCRGAGQDIQFSRFWAKTRIAYLSAAQ